LLEIAAVQEKGKSMANTECPKIAPFLLSKRHGRNVVAQKHHGKQPKGKGYQRDSPK
jgi:hypothetical protein